MPSNVPTQADFDALTARVVALESGAPKPPPPAAPPPAAPPPAAPPSGQTVYIGANQAMTASTGKYRLDGEQNAFWTPINGTEVSMGTYGDIGWNANQMANASNVIYIQDTRDKSWHIFDPGTRKYSASVPPPGGAAPPGQPPAAPPPAPPAQPPAPPVSGTSFSDNFASFDSKKWFRSGGFDDGGTGWFSNDPWATNRSEVYTGGHLDLGCVAFNGNTAGAPNGKNCFAGIIDQYNGGNGFLQLYGYWEFTGSCDKLPGFGLYCFPNQLQSQFWVGMPNIWTDQGGTQQLKMFASGVSMDFFLSEGQQGWKGTDTHAYGFNWTQDRIELYLDRRMVSSSGNPGGRWKTDGMYTKIHAQSSFYPSTSAVDANRLPVFGHCISFNIWRSKPF